MINSMSFWKYCLEKIPHLKDLYPGIDHRQLAVLLEDYSEDQYFQAFINSSIEKLKQGIPIAYMRGKSYFYESEFYVDRTVLIPRFETELLVSNALEILSRSSYRSLKIMEVGVGSGSVLLSLLKKIDIPLNVVASDSSADALKVFSKNLFHHRFSISQEMDLKIHHGDRLHGLQEKNFDLIISNPPYIKREADRECVHPMVHKHEPEESLTLKDDIYDEWFDIFFGQVYDALQKGGAFLMEGHEEHLQDLLCRVKGKGFKKFQLLKDLLERTRFLKAIK